MMTLTMTFPLNKNQKKAVEHSTGPLLVLAGAGSGKTRVIVERIKHLIQTGTDPSVILAVTFTNKAAREMKERILGTDMNLYQEFREEGPFVSTFHSLGVYILRSHGEYVGVPRRFKIFDRGDSVRALKTAMARVNINPKEFEPRTILGTISKAKGDAMSLPSYEEQATLFYPRIVATAWREYEKVLRAEKALDFDDLLLRLLVLLETKESVRTFYQKKWKYIHIDEYQDTNAVQSKLGALLTHPENNICAVGDVDQNIYSWRGATIENMLAFEKTYPSTTIITLEQNYRSTQNILDASNTIIKKNKRRPPKESFTENSAGEKIALSLLNNESDEAAFVCQRARELHQKGVPFKDMAVLYRANFQSRALEEAFLSHKVPYQVLGVRFFERKEVKDILAFIRAALERESWSDIRRVINIPPRGVGKVTFLKLTSGKEHALSGKMKANVDAFWKLLDDIRDALERQPLSEAILFILHESGLKAYLQKGAGEDVERLENIRELAAFCKRYNHLDRSVAVEKLLEEAALLTDQDELEERHEAVKLMTVHASKGLEFDTIFVTGLEDGLFPHHSLSEKNNDEEEERRLFYVALTRAKRKVFLTYAATRTVFGSKGLNTASEFIHDIPEDRFEIMHPEGEEQTIYI